MGCMLSCSKTATEEAMPEPEILSVDSVLSNADALYNDTIMVKGVCKHLCKHGGKKAFLIGSDTTLFLRCDATDAIGGAFAVDCPGKELTVVGVLTPITLTKSEIEARVAAEIAAAEAENAEGHCDTDKRANGTAAQWLEKLNAQMAVDANDTILIVGRTLQTTSYTIAE